MEIILELCDNSLNNGSKMDVNDVPKYDRNLNPFENDDHTTSSTATKHRFSLNDVKLPNMKKLMKPKREKVVNDLCLKITTSKMRCSIKVKEEFENDAGEKFWLNFLSKILFVVLNEGRTSDMTNNPYPVDIDFFFVLQHKFI